MTTLLLALLSPAHATNTIADCSTGDAPSAYDSEPCTIASVKMCTFGPGFTQTTMYCGGGGAFDEITEARLVYSYDGSGVIAAWGDVDDGGTNRAFCCRLNDNDSVTTRFVFNGTDGDDFINFWHNDASGSSDLESHLGATAIKGIMYGGDGVDTLQGSYENSSTYSEYLYGDADNDLINGFNGDDFLQAGAGDDIANGNSHDDQVWGNAGEDALTGGPHDDCVIDRQTCPNVDGNSLEGGGDNDYLWVGYDGASCATSFTVDGGGGTDYCGDSDWAAGYAGNFSNCTLNIATFTDFQTDSGCTVPSP